MLFRGFISIYDDYNIIYWIKTNNAAKIWSPLFRVNTNRDAITNG